MTPHKFQTCVSFLPFAPNFLAAKAALDFTLLVSSLVRSFVSYTFLTSLQGDLHFVALRNFFESGTYKKIEMWHLVLEGMNFEI